MSVLLSHGFTNEWNRCSSGSNLPTQLYFHIMQRFAAYIYIYIYIYIYMCADYRFSIETDVLHTVVLYIRAYIKGGSLDI